MKKTSQKIKSWVWRGWGAFWLCCICDAMLTMQGADRPSVVASTGFAIPAFTRLACLIFFSIAIAKVICFFAELLDR